MTTQKISDAARELAEALRIHYSISGCGGERCYAEVEGDIPAIAREIQRALTAARQEGAREMRRRAARYLRKQAQLFRDGKGGGEYEASLINGFADAIRDLPVEE